jgi:hypothetical protein
LIGSKEGLGNLGRHLETVEDVFDRPMGRRELLRLVGVLLAKDSRTVSSKCEA